MKKILIPFIALVFFLYQPFYYLCAQEDKNELKINSEFKCSRLKIGKDNFILDYKFEDINGDNEKDNIILIGRKFDKYNPSLIHDIKVIIQDTKTKRYYSISVGKLNTGLNGKLFLGDFDGDRVNDILVSIGNVNSPYYSLFSFKNNKCKYLMTEDQFLKGLNYRIDFINNFKVKIINESLKDLYILDVSNKKAAYISIGLYRDNGQLPKENKGSYDSINSLVPLDEDKNGVYEIKCIQTIWGINPLDTLGYGKTIWEYGGKKMKLKSYEFLEFASPGSKEKFQKVLPVGRFH